MLVRETKKLSPCTMCPEGSAAGIPSEALPTLTTNRNSIARCKGSANSLPRTRRLWRKGQPHSAADGGGSNSQGNPDNFGVTMVL